MGTIEGQGRLLRRSRTVPQRQERTAVIAYRLQGLPPSAAPPLPLLLRGNSGVCDTVHCRIVSMKYLGHLGSPSPPPWANPEPLPRPKMAISAAGRREVGERLAAQDYGLRSRCCYWASCCRHPTSHRWLAISRGTPWPVLGRIILFGERFTRAMEQGQPPDPNTKLPMIPTRATSRGRNMSVQITARPRGTRAQPTGTAGRLDNNREAFR